MSLDKWPAALLRQAAGKARSIKQGASLFESGTKVGRHIMPSLRRERFLPLKIVMAIQEIFAAVTPASLVAVTDRYKNYCYSKVLKGGVIKLRPLPARLGRAVEERAFVDAVVAANGGRFTSAQISALVDRLVAGSLSATDRRIMASMRMSPYSAWVTWDMISNGVDDPFAFSSSRCADEIRANLGLSSVVAGAPILLLYYDGTAASKIFRPTCADAGLFLRFAPPPRPPPNSFDAYGQTKPWEDEKGYFPDARPRPEAVHAGILFPAAISADLRPRVTPI